MSLKVILHVKNKKMPHDPRTIMYAAGGSRSTAMFHSKWLVFAV
jgi:hypothetical protein